MSDESPSIQQQPGDPYRFRTAIQNIAPAWLQRQWGSRFLYAIGLNWDAFAEAARQGVRARCPGVDGAPTDALAYIGRDRVLIRGPAESDDAFAARLRQAFEAWQRAGSMEGQMRQCQAFFTPTSIIALMVNNQARWAYIGTTGGPIEYSVGDPAAWNWDGSSSTWARCWLILHIPGDWMRYWGDSTWGTGSWGTIKPATYPQSLRQIVAAWKSAATVVQIILAYEPEWPDPAHAPDVDYPDGTWNEPYVIRGGAAVSPRYAFAAYLEPVR